MGCGANKGVEVVESAGWFHGVLPRQDVEPLLARDGDFLVRLNRDDQYVLSLCWRGCRHYLVTGTPGRWKLGDLISPTVYQLVTSLMTSGQPVSPNSGAILIYPVERQNWLLDNDDIRLGQKIGQGSMGVVYLGWYCGQAVAVKLCEAGRGAGLGQEERARLLREARLLQRLRHPNLVRLLGVAARREPVMLVLQFVQGGSLLNYLRRESENLETSDLLHVSRDVARGLAYLHEQGIVHRDLATRNCLVEISPLQVKISDLGMSWEGEYAINEDMPTLPIKWTAPEVFTSGVHTSASDVFSFGILLWEVFSRGRSPFGEMTNSAARENIIQGWRMEQPAGTPAPVYALMSRCWSPQPERRPDASTIAEDVRRIAGSLTPTDVQVPFF